MKYLKYLFLFIFLCFIGLCLRPVPHVTVENAQVQKGIVSNITEGGVKDAVFHLHNTDRIFYINRGLENKFDLESLQQEMLGKAVTITFAKHWTPLDWNDKGKHIAKLEVDGRVVYSELSDLVSIDLSYSK